MTIGVHFKTGLMCDAFVYMDAEKTDVENMTSHLYWAGVMCTNPLNGAYVVYCESLIPYSICLSNPKCQVCSYTRY